MEKYLYDTYLAILKEELLPAFGCTEPIAIAYAAAMAREILNEIPDQVEIIASGNIIKNVKSVIVPGTGGKRGICAAAAAGIIAGDSSKKLEVLSQIPEEKYAEIQDFAAHANITIDFSDSDLVFDLIIRLSRNGSFSKIRLAGFHTNIVLLEKDGKILYEKPLPSSVALKDSSEKKELIQACENEVTFQEDSQNKELLTVEQIFHFANEVSLEEIRETISRQISYNMEIAEEGLRHNYGANVGQTLLKVYGDSLYIRARAKAAAASDARMNGCALPVVINSGSGNQGITVSVPVIEYARSLHIDEERLYRALVISNLTAIHQKAGIGSLSAYCGAVSAGSACGAGIAYLLGGKLHEIEHTIVNALAITSGIICDGAKASCAAKISSAVDAGLLGYYMILENQQFRAGDGIVKKGVERTISCVSRLGRDGMKETDKEILDIMLNE